MSVRSDSLCLADVPAAAALHVRSFDRFFLSSLGEPFLREFYRGFVADPDAVTAVSRADDGHLVGVVVGTVAPDEFFRRLLRSRLPQLTWTSGRAVVRHPRSASRILRGIMYRGSVPLDVSGALLSSICVDPQAAHAGRGQKLLASWWDRVQARGTGNAYLTTDADDNARVNEFYTRAGWSQLGSYLTPEGRRMNCYSIETVDRGRP